MKKTVGIITALFILFAFASASASAQDDDLFGGSSDEDMFSSDDSLFGSDDMFEDVTAKEGSDEELSPALLFENGSVRFGGSLTTKSDVIFTWIDPFSASLNNTLNGDFLAKGARDAIFSPLISADLFADARIEENLRVYGKVKIGYPFEKISIVKTTPISSIALPNFSVMELFSDFSWDDKLFFRFGKHAVTWGTGYFFSPVSDMINTTQIDPEHPDEEVEGGISLRTQVVFPGTQNCLWLYLIPSINQSGVGMVKYTAGAAKFEFLLGGWEFGTGVWGGYQNPLRLMLTASGSIAGKVSVFGEGVFSWGTSDDWKTKQFGDMTPVFKATLGSSYFFKEPKITLAGQYLLDTNAGLKIEKVIHASDSTWSAPLFNLRHSLVLSLSFSDLFGSKKLAASLFGMGSINNSFSTDTVSALANASLTWIVFKHFSLSFTPGIAWTSQFVNPKMQPNMSFKISAKFGGGRF